MKRIPLLLSACLLVGGCGGGGDGSTGPELARTTEHPATKRDGGGMRKQHGKQHGTGKGATITAGESEFGEMLFGSNKQAIYIFEKDPAGESVCYDGCAEAWPPVLTSAAPKAAGGVKADLLGTVRRRDGRLQVTYNGKPLYFYAHEAPGEVRCHNVDLNGGLWWVVGPDGKRRP